MDIALTSIIYSNVSLTFFGYNFGCLSSFVDVVLIDFLVKGEIDNFKFLSSSDAQGHLVMSIVKLK